MRRVTVYKTNDGATHSDLYSAKNYLGEKYGNIISSLAHQLAHKNKYTEFCEFIDENLDKFKELVELQAELNYNDTEYGYED